jgi:hypothetical protein
MDARLIVNANYDLAHRNLITRRRRNESTWLSLQEGKAGSIIAGKYKTVRKPHAVMPNPSLKRSANGRPPSPGRWYAVHFHRPGLGVLPLSPA